MSEGEREYEQGREAGSATPDVVHHDGDFNGC
jgi:hypothetical protein